MLPRTIESIVQTLPDWVVAVAEARAARQVIGGACLTTLAPELAEVRSLVVDSDWQGEGIGRQLVERIIDMARARGYQQLCALTLAPRSGVDCQHCSKNERCNEYALVMDLVPNPVLPNWVPLDLSVWPK